jgi:hypothetical protein
MESRPRCLLGPNRTTFRVNNSLGFNSSRWTSPYEISEWASKMFTTAILFSVSTLIISAARKSNYMSALYLTHTRAHTHTHTHTHTHIIYIYIYIHTMVYIFSHFQEFNKFVILLLALHSYLIFNLYIMLINIKCILDY